MKEIIVPLSLLYYSIVGGPAFIDVFKLYLISRHLFNGNI